MSEIISIRRCTKCLTEKPLTKEFWYHQFKGRSQFQFVCKKCYSEIDRLRYLKNKEYIKNRVKNKKDNIGNNSMDAPLIKIEKIEN